MFNYFVSKNMESRCEMLSTFFVAFYEAVRKGYKQQPTILKYFCIVYIEINIIHITKHRTQNAKPRKLLIFEGIC